jgi:carbamoyltransferase
MRKQVVARFAGRMEYGPRALGSRSILVHAGDPTINTWLNARLKRTEFMPFAPVTLEEEADDCYTGLDGARHSARFMTVTTDCTESFKAQCPATVHIDGTARPQLVERNDDTGYRAILEAYRARTGFSTIINTSYNMHEEPIVCTPADAIRAFKLGHLDVLAIGGFLVHSPQAGADVTAVDAPAASEAT